MTIWTPFPCDLERCYYDVELKSGAIIRKIWPLIRKGEPDTFYKPSAPVLAEWRIARVRVFDETNKD